MKYRVSTSSRPHIGVICARLQEEGDGGLVNPDSPQQRIIISHPPASYNSHQDSCRVGDSNQPSLCSVMPQETLGIPSNKRNQKSTVKLGIWSLNLDGLNLEFNGLNLEFSILYSFPMSIDEIITIQTNILRRWIFFTKSWIRGEGKLF